MRTLLFGILSLFGIFLVKTAADEPVLVRPTDEGDGSIPLNGSSPDKLVSASFPPSRYLGFSLDTTATMPLDIDSVTASVKAFKRLIRLPNDGSTQRFPGGADWKVPTNANVTSARPDGKQGFRSFLTGSQAEKALDGGSSDSDDWEIVTGGRHGFFASYPNFKQMPESTNVLSFTFSKEALATPNTIKGTADIKPHLDDVDAGVKKTYQENYQYAVYEYNAPRLQVAFLDWKQDVEWSFLEDYVLRQPSAFDPADAKILESYRKFFNLLGTHVITAVSFGARMTCAAWASNADSGVNENFDADIQASFNGLVSDGDFDESIKTTPQYTTFLSYVQQLCSISGGDERLAAPIRQDPQSASIHDVYKQWLPGSGMHANITGFQTIPIWVLISGSENEKLVQRADNFRTAYHYFVEHPQKHVTKCRLTVNSDWGDMNLLTPSAYIEVDESMNPPDGLPNGTYYSSTKIGWQSPESPPVAERDVTIDFVITNDGTPIDIDLSHGTAGVLEPGKGRIQVSIAGISYENNIMTDSHVNRVPFYNLAVYPWPKYDLLDGVPKLAASTYLPPVGDSFLRKGPKQPADIANNSVSTF